MVPTYFFLNEITIAEKELKWTRHDEPNTVINGENFYVGELGFPVHLYVVTTWIGLLLTTVCGGIGIVFLPYNLLNDWIFRPKPVSRPDFVRRQ